MKKIKKEINLKEKLKLQSPSKQISLSEILTQSLEHDIN